MEFFVSLAAPAKQRTDCAIVGVYDKGTLSAAAEELDARIGGRIARLVKRGDLRGKAGDVVLLADVSRRAGRTRRGRRPRRTQFFQAQAIPQGAGERARRRRPHRREGRGQLSRRRRRRRCRRLCARRASRSRSRSNSQYRIPDHKTANKRQKPTLTKLGIAVGGRGDRGNAERAIAHGEGIGAGVSLMRDLANQPANVCTPGYLAKAARNLAREHRKITVRVLNETECRRLQMGSFLSVTRGTRGACVPDRPRVQRRHARRGADGPGRQGRDVRHRRHFVEAAAGDGRDEVRHERRGERARHVQGDRDDGSADQRGRRRAGVREHAERPRDQARRHRQEHVGPDDRRF